MSENQQTMNRRGLLRLALYNTAGACVGTFFGLGALGQNTPEGAEDLSSMEWGYIVDTTRCIGCGACVRACKMENGVPDSYYRTWVERYEIGEDEEVQVDSPDGAINSFHPRAKQDVPPAKAFFVPKICNHCRNSACTQVCPTCASYHSPDGVVLIDRKRCVGCGYCVQACPYGCRYISHPPGTADKCTLCYHRIHKGLAPACVQACPREARLYGNLKDPESRIRKILNQRRYYLLKPDLGTNPKCYYIGLDLEVK